MDSCSVRSREIPTEIWFSISSLFGMCDLILKQLSYSFRESSAIFTDLLFFTVITIGETKESSSTSLKFLDVWFLLVSLIVVLHLLVGEVVPVWLFV